MLWQIVITDKSNLSGGAVLAMIKDIRAMANLSFVRVLQFEGAAPSGVPTFCETGKYTNFDDFYSFLQTVIQVDWTTFELSYEKLDADKKNDYARAAIDNIEKGAIVVRCVDNSLFYVYTKDKKVSTGLSERYNTLCCELVDSQNVEWPE